MKKNKWFTVLGWILIGSLIQTVPADGSLFSLRKASTKSQRFWTEYGSGAKRPNTNSNSVLVQFQNEIRSLTQRLVPAVVNIYTTTIVHKQQGGLPFGGGGQHDLFRFFFEEFFKGHPGFQMPPQEIKSLGSGFVINADGYIITNAHVIEKADVIRVKFDEDRLNKSLEFEASVVGADRLSDVALLKIKPTTTLSVIPLGNSDRLKQGDIVMAIGNPFGHGHSVTQGIVSAVGREIERLTPYSSFIQTDASIHPGNSGGPLINIHGEVVGINTAIDVRGAGIGFALPINKAKKILGDLKRVGKVVRGWIGVSMGPEMDEERTKIYKVKHGVIINDVIPGEPAQKAGIRKGDIITHFNQKPIRTRNDLLIFVSEVRVGQTVPVKVWRKRKVLSFDITVAQRPSEDSGANLRGQKHHDRNRGELKKLGINAVGLTAAHRQKLKLPPKAKGILVTRIHPMSLAARSGLREGDVIEEVNLHQIDSVDAFEWHLKRAHKSNAKYMDLGIIRDGERRHILLRLKN